jgi:fluoroacetyl-CoA thioesterase
MNLPADVAGEMSVLVTSESAVDFMGLEDARVLGTPYLIALLEMTARNAVKPYLPEGHDTVGTHVDVRHLAATPLGMHARFHAHLMNTDGRRLRFRVEAFDEREKIAEGTHERAVIDIARFAARVQGKRHTNP